jgi:Protein of unknown function (DUF4242)
MRAFVGEQYLPANGSAAAARGADAAGRAAEQLTREGTPVQFVRSIFVPEDETCFHLYLAESVESVQAAAGRAALRLDRVAEAVGYPGSTQDREAI